MLRFVVAAISKTDEAVVDYGKGDPEGAGTEIIVSMSEDGQSLQSTGERLVIAGEPGVGHDVGSLHTLNVGNPDPSNVVPAGLADDGVRVVTAGGIITSEGGASSRGDLSGKTLKEPIVAADTATIPDSYWLVASDGGVFAFGDAPFNGSMGGAKLAQPVVSAAATPSGKGYWLLAADGGVFALGDASYSGRDDGSSAKDALKIVPSAAGAGYRIVHSDATVTSHGSLPALSKTSSTAKVVTATA
jgi:hypothetical protein